MSDDIIDRASEVEEQQRQQAIAAQLDKSARYRMTPTGKCHNCCEPLDGGALFCDSDCSSDHEARMRATRY